MKKVQTLDYVVNFFWTGIGFLPLVIYWRQTPLTIIFYGFLLISVIFANISQKIHHLFRLSSKTKTYEFLGVKLVRKFIQDGDYIRKGNPGIKSKDEAKKYLLRILMYERFHTLCLLFFTFSMIHSLINSKVWAGLFILLSNVLFNVYPLLLQQYNRLRISRLLEKMER